VRQRLFTLFLPLLSVFAGAAVPATVDVALLVRAGVTQTPLEALYAWVLSLGLCSMALIPAAVALGAACVVACWRQDPAHGAASLWGAARGWITDRSGGASAAAWLYSAAISLAFFLVAGAALARYCFTAFKNLDLAAVLFAGLIVVLLGAAAVLLLLLRRVARRLLSSLGGTWQVLATLPASLAIIAAVMIAALLGLLLAYRPLVELLDWRPLLYLVPLAAVPVLLMAASLRARARRLGRKARPGPVSRALPAAATLALLLSWGLCLTTLDRSPALRAVLLDRCYGASSAHDMLGLALDFDGDGYLSLFGGGDCAPGDPAINPGAVEVPGNGRDDDCAGGDADPARATPRTGRTYAFPLPSTLAGPRPSFLLITLDGLRPANLGCYGYERPTSPNMDRLARAGVLFERAYAQGPATHVAVPSLLASRYPLRIPRKKSRRSPRPISRDALLMAEVFREAGYRTGAVLGSRVFDRDLQLDQGFDYYNLDQAPYYEGKGAPGWDMDQPYPLVKAAAGFMRRNQGRRFLLWVHIMEPHPPWVRREAPHDFGSDTIDAYDGELHFADSKVGQVLAALGQTSAARRTVVLLTADHGAGFGARGAEGSLLYNEDIHVPLLIRVPGLAPRRVRNPVAHVDVLPTMVNLARIRRPFLFDGQTLVPQLVHGTEPSPRRPILVEHHLGVRGASTSRAVILGAHKLLYNAVHNTYRLYDLSRDPDETVDLAPTRPALLKRLKAALAALIQGQ